MSHSALNYFERYKHTSKTNELAWLNEKLFISYGNIVQVLDINTVVAVFAANTDGFEQPITLTLLRPSSALFENSVEPQEGDRVLILALNLKARGMFDSQEPVTDPKAPKYNMYSGVGVLMATFKGAASTKLTHDREEDHDLLNLDSSAIVGAVFSRALTAIFDSIGENEELVKLVFGRLSPLLEKHRAGVTREHGFDLDGDGNEIAVPAPVSERLSVEAPITRDIQGAQTTTVGFDAEGEITEAPLVETYSNGAPITRDIQGAQTVKIGIDADGEATEAPVNVEVGENADINIASASGMTLHFDKAVVFEAGDSQTWEIAGDLTIKVDGKVNITSSGCTINNVLEIK